MEKTFYIIFRIRMSIGSGLKMTRVCIRKPSRPLATLGVFCLRQNLKRASLVFARRVLKDAAFRTEAYLGM